MGEVVTLDRSHPERVARQAAETLVDGGVVVLPTDSVYGICCAAAPGNPAHGRIFDIKRRDRAQTLPLFVADASDLARYGRDVPAWALRLAERLWPGALTLVVRASGDLPAEYAQPDADGPTVALRVPGLEFVRDVVRVVGSPVAQTSANTHGNPAARRVAELEPALVEAVDLIVDAGPAPIGVASTIVDATAPAPRVLRAGALSEDEVLLAAR